MGLALVAGGCFTTTTDFRDHAEEYLRTDTGVQAETGTAFVSVTCEEPVDRDVGTRFTCTAIDVEDRRWEFRMTIRDGGYRAAVSRQP